MECIDRKKRERKKQLISEIIKIKIRKANESKTLPDSRQIPNWMRVCNVLANISIVTRLGNEECGRGKRPVIIQRSAEKLRVWNGIGIK